MTEYAWSREVSGDAYWHLQGIALLQMNFNTATSNDTCWKDKEWPYVVMRNAREIKKICSRRLYCHFTFTISTINCFLLSFTIVTEKFECLYHKHSGKLLSLIGHYQNLSFPKCFLATQSNTWPDLKRQSSEKSRWWQSCFQFYPR